MNDDEPSAAQGLPKTILHVGQPMTGEVTLVGWWEVEFGEHDWHQPDPLKNPHQVGPWEPFVAP